MGRGADLMKLVGLECRSWCCNQIPSPVTRVKGCKDYN